MAKLPLSHIKVLDLAAHRAGPTAVRQLADWGAQVIKIEQPPEPGSKTDAMGGSRHGFDFQNLHRNKQAITLNLKSKEGHAIFMKLAKKADVIVENYRSDVKYRLKVDYKSVKKEPEDRLRLDRGLRPGRPGCRAPRRRPDRPGHGRADVDHR